jgi:aminoglycoside phosphotransferase (APT) family kinase protein
MLEPREYSKRLGVLTHQQLQAALDHFDLGLLLDAEPAPGGLFGQIVLLTTANDGYVLRGNPHEGQLERERYVAEIIHARTRVPVPWPYRIEDDPALFGWPYAIMPRLPGVQPADPEVRGQLTREDRTGIVVALADCLALLHGAAFDAVASYDAEVRGFRPAPRAYVDWFGDWTRWWLDRCRAASPATTDGDVAWVESVVADARAPLAEPFTPCLVHTDYKENNTVAQKVGGRWRISGLFDLAEAHAGDGEYDLARAYCEYVLHRPELAQAYLRAYLALRPPRPGFEARFRHYVIHDRLIIWEYGQRNRVWFTPDQTLRPWAEPFLAIPEP